MIPGMPDQTLDVKNLTPDKLYGYVIDMITSGYAELPNYVYVMSDFLTVGTHKFNEDLAKTRGWSNRIMGMLQQARQVNAHVATMAKGKTRIYETDLVRYITTADKAVFKGLDASERKLLAAQNCTPAYEEAAKWETLRLEMKAYIDALEDRQKDLHVARQDLRSQLWAVRLHGVLGELAKEAQDGDSSGAPAWLMAQQGGGSRPFTGSPQTTLLAVDPPPDGEVVERDYDIDALLAEGQSNGHIR
jgi:hypothetical protein